jgi:hypothetical protein
MSELFDKINFDQQAAEMRDMSKEHVHDSSNSLRDL